MKRPDLIARAIIWKGGALLVNGNTNKKTGESYVALPGGHVDPGESCVEALQREIEEELDAKCVLGDLAFVAENIYDGREPDEKQRHEITLIWEAQISGETTRSDGTIESPEKWKNFHWLSEDELEEANLLPHDVKTHLLGQINARYAFSDTRTKKN
jgi:ADP-ribose pyrophosphatase YjhB (NUDIX family)